MKLVKKLTAGLLCIVTIISLVACSSRERVSKDTFTAACAEVGLTVEDRSASSVNSTGLTEYVLATSDEANAELLTYESESQANQVYAEAVSAMKNDNATVEKKIDSSGYKKYYISNGDSYSAIALVNCTIVYGKQDTNNDIIRNLFKAINYN